MNQECHSLPIVQSFLEPFLGTNRFFEHNEKKDQKTCRTSHSRLACEMTSVSVALLPWRPSLRDLSRCQHLAAQQNIVQDTIPEPVHLETGTPSFLPSLPILSQFQMKQLF